MTEVLMDSKLKTRWVKALRSGRYTQDKGSLERADKGKYKGNCCLGVLCRVAKVKKMKFFGEIVFGSSKSSGYLAGDLLTKFGLTQPQQEILADMNDNQQKTFKDIAAWIQRNIKTKRSRK